jgi:ribosome modulation factor
MDLQTRKQSALDEAVEKEFADCVAHGKRRFGLNAFKQGWLAGVAGKCSNPYPDYRTPDGKVTFSRGYHRAWERGYRAYRAFEDQVVKEIRKTLAT